MQIIEEHKTLIVILLVCNVCKCERDSVFFLQYELQKFILENLNDTTDLKLPQSDFCVSFVYNILAMNLHL